MPGEVEFDLGSAMDTVAEELASGTGAAGGEVQKEESPPEGSPSPSPAPPPDGGAPPPQEGTPPPPPAPPTPPAEPTPYPKSWKPDLQAKWDALDPDVRKEVLRREDDFHKGITPLRNAATFVQRFQQASAPIADLLRSGVDPIALYSNFAQAHAKLSAGGPDAAAFLRSLAADYKIDLEAQPAYVDPNLQALQQRVDRVDSQLSAREQAEAQSRRAAVASQIEAFAADPQNALFETVGSEMAAFLKADPGMTLKDAYAKAVWANPVAREKQLAKELQVKQEAAAAAEAERAAKAAAASKGSVRSTARTAPATGAVGSIDDTMRETLAALRKG